MRKKKKETKAMKLRRLRSQGRYLGVLRYLTKGQRKKVAEYRDAYGIRAAMQLARSLLKAA